MSQSPSRAAQRELAELSQLMSQTDLQSRSSSVAGSPHRSRSSERVHPQSPTRATFSNYKYEPAPVIASAPASSSNLYSQSSWRQDTQSLSSADESTPSEANFSQARSAAPLNTEVAPRIETLQQQLAQQMAADQELQQSLREFSSSLNRAANATTATTAAAPQTNITYSRYESQTHTYSDSMQSSLQSSAAPSPGFGATAYPSLPNAHFPSLSSNYPILPTQHNVQQPVYPPAQTQTSRQMVDIEFARHEAALAHARQRLEAMGLGLKSTTAGAAPGRFVAPYPSLVTAKSSAANREFSAPISGSSSFAPSSSYQPSTHAPSIASHEATVGSSTQLTENDDDDSVLTSSGDDDEEEQQHPPQQQQQRRPATSSAKGSAKNRPHSSRSSSVERGRSGATSDSSVEPRRGANRSSSTVAMRRPLTAGVRSAPVAKPPGTFGSAHKGAVNPALSKRSSLAPPARKSPVSSPVRPSAYSSLAIATHHANSVNSTDGLSSATTTDDVALQWADRYKTLLNRNMNIQKKNKELNLRNQAQQASITELSNTVQSLTDTKTELEEEINNLKEKLAAAKSVLKAERESAAFHAQKHVQSLEASQMSEINKLRHTYDGQIEELEKSNAELKRRAKNLQILSHGTQAKLDARNVEYEKLLMESNQQIDELQVALATGTAQLNQANSKAIKRRKDAEDREEKIEILMRQLKESDARAARFHTQLQASESDREELSSAFRSMREWGTGLMKHVRSSAEEMESEARRVREIKDAQKVQQEREEEEQQKKQLQRQAQQVSEIQQHSAVAPVSPKRVTFAEPQGAPEISLPPPSSSPVTTTTTTHSTVTTASHHSATFPSDAAVANFPQSSELRRTWAQIDAELAASHEKQALLNQNADALLAQYAQSPTFSSPHAAPQQRHAEASVEAPAGSASIASPLSQLQERLRKLQR